MIKQDLHIHTVYSSGDGAVVPEQKISLIASLNHAGIVGISDHLEAIHTIFDIYEKDVRSHNLLVGTEVDGYEWTDDAIRMPADYYIYHCRDRKQDYYGAERLLSTGKPVIIAHPLFLRTDLFKVPPECYIEISNRYIWRNNWREEFLPFLDRFRFVLGSDAHQPNWLNQTVARHVADELGVEETILFRKKERSEKIKEALVSINL